ncbi:MAG: succinyldiaminopimelate transaminase [Betaproteobacteria bacterium]|nr:succinyldiaminopimelate transaminase [Betaproteobacteria bacterium]
MNPDLARLHPYPFQKLSQLVATVRGNPALPHVNLSIGEPKHPTPGLVLDALKARLDGLATYPATIGSASLRETIAAWLSRRYGIPAPDPATEVLPVNGSREALFAFAQAVVDRSAGAPPVVVMPNPFYQIYEGAALLAGARPAFLNQLPENGFGPDFGALPEESWSRTQLVYLCSPGNPTGRVLTLDEWKTLFDLSDRFGFVIASDECYSEIHFDEANPPLGALQAAHRLGRSGFPRLVVFSSLSKRSNVPGMRSGFVAGDRQVLKSFLLYRTYHGSAMSPSVQAASEAAWRDETHVVENRRQYGQKFSAVLDILDGVPGARRPEAGFYLWLPVPGDDTVFARNLLEQYNVTVLPGSFLARDANGLNPGNGFVRIALVAPLDECTEAARRLAGCFREHR